MKLLEWPLAVRTARDEIMQGIPLVKAMRTEIQSGGGVGGSYSHLFQGPNELQLKYRTIIPNKQLKTN